MPVVFDEVQGSVVADEATPSTEPHPDPRPTQPDPEKLHHWLRHRDRRAARLKAD
ncbi:hypothetical protein AB3R30_07290 [Leptolyngbyaceae cyanobacterium UHCC 1019]